MKIKTIISWEDEEFGRSERIEYGRECDDLDVGDFLEYVLTMAHHAGFDLKQISAVGCNNNFWSTDL